MSMIKNEIPILEFDTAQTAVINPTHENLELKLPKWNEVSRSYYLVNGCG